MKLYRVDELHADNGVTRSRKAGALQVNHMAESQPDRGEEADSRGESKHLRRMFDPEPPVCALGASGISLLFKLLREHDRRGGWPPVRSRVHARVLLDLERDYYFTDEESAYLSEVEKRAI